MPLVSIIIPWYLPYGDEGTLSRCLNACFAQSYPRHLYEIIVVDNHELPRAVQGSYSKEIVLVHQAIPGSYAARAAGVMQSKGSILAFVDSDCVPQRTWLEEGIKALQLLDLKAVVGGRIVFSFKAPNPNLFELYDSIAFLNQERNIRERGFASTANMFVAKDAYERIGGFDQKVFSGGDVDFCHKAAHSGYKIIYTPEATVFHPARSSFFALRQKIQRVADGYYDRSAFAGVRKKMDFRSAGRQFSLRILHTLLVLCAMYEIAGRFVGRKAKRD